MAKRIPTILTRARTRTAERRSAGFNGSGATGMSAFLPAPVMSGVAVTPETALTFTAVFAAINTIATDTAGLPMRVMRQGKGGGRVAVTADARYDLVYCEPNEDTTSMRLRQAAMGHVLTWGNAYLEIERLADGTPAALHLMSPKPADTWPDRTRGGRLFYQADGGRQTLPAEDVVHLAGLGWDGLCGYSPVALARQAVGLGIAAEQFGASLFGNGSVPKGAIKYPGKLTKEGKQNIRESWEVVHQGSTNGNRVAVLDGGMEFTPFGLPPEDSQFLQTRQFQVIEIARIYRLPPHKLGDYQHSHLANIEESNLDYLNTTLGPWLEVWEQELNRKLFTSRERAFGLHVAHDTSALLRGNAAARAAIYSQLAANGGISPDEIRDREGLNPIPDDAGKVYFYSVNNQVLWSAKGDPAGEAAAEALAAAEAGPDAQAAEDAGSAGDQGDDS